MSKLLVIVGGSKGISKSLSLTFSQNGYKSYILSRSLPKFDYDIRDFLDIENDESIDYALTTLVDYINENSFEKISFHFMTGGSLGLYSNQIAKNRKKYLDIAHHNLIFPLWFTEQISERLENIFNLKIHFNYYLSAVQGSLDSHPMYIASKSGLQAAFKSLVCKRKPNFIYSGFVLGMVDVSHKYLHKLSKSDPLQFDEILNSKIPSLNFAKPDDISKFICECSNHPSLSNGMLVDISGGGSWIQAKQ
tara:strand:+ start:5573 stop:6319 length:747 start_codon:yes stop_codon:yes gene_type:complete